MCNEVFLMVARAHGLSGLFGFWRCISKELQRVGCCRKHVEADHRLVSLRSAASVEAMERCLRSNGSS